MLTTVGSIPDWIKLMDAAGRASPWVELARSAVACRVVVAGDDLGPARPNPAIMRRARRSVTVRTA
jgi:hypothetical protein